ncbi:MAG: P-II family nitrogen regulator [Bacilli bacterium]|jgi:nitrogen regulatory protein PII|nr:P-II family nitrogen regulator [Bacilli bacterium]
MNNLLSKDPLIKKISSARKSEAPAVPYDQSHVLDQLYFFAAIVPDDQGGAIVKNLMGSQGALAFLTHGNGTANRDFYDVFGRGEDQKQVVLSLITGKTWEEAKPAIAERFRISQYTKGIAFIIRLSAICNVSVYKMLTNNRLTGPAPAAEGAKTMETAKTWKDNYELVVVIVNEGFTDLVMDAAKRAGARGGTILSARGTGNKDMEKFFGVVITPEKQVLLILVPQDIRDKVLESINQEAGIDTKGQGIAFAVHAQDVVGLSGEEEVPALTEKEAEK